MMKLDESLSNAAKRLFEIEPVAFGDIKRDELIGIALPYRRKDSLLGFHRPEIDHPEGVPKDACLKDNSVLSLSLDPLFAEKDVLKYISPKEDKVNYSTGVLFSERLIGVTKAEKFEKWKLLGRNFSSKKGCPIYLPVAEMFIPTMSENVYDTFWQDNLVRPIYASQQEEVGLVREAILKLRRDGYKP